MKCKLCLMLLVFAMVIISGCEKDDDKLVVYIADYFVVDGAQLIEDKLPQTSESSGRPEIKSVQGNSKVVNGGVTGIQLSADNQFSKIIVGLEGQEIGYYEITDYTKPTSNSASFTLLLDDELSESMTLLLAIANSEGLVSSYKEMETKLVETLGGALQINCSWDLLNDIDLHVVTPDGNEIYYGNPGIEYDYVGIINHFLSLNIPQGTNLEDIDLTDDQLDLLDNLSADAMRDFATLLPGGSLDIDSNPSCETDSINSENIVLLAEDVKAGEYIVRVDFYDDCVGTGVTNFLVSAKLNGALISTNNANPVSGSFNSGEHDYGDKGDGVEVMRFTISENQLKSASTAKGFTYNDFITSKNKPTFSAILKSKSKISK